MKSYLSLIPISAKVHRRQNRMTLLCIIFAVFMVTVVFSMAEMGAKMEQERLSQKHGNFSIQQVFDTTMGQTLLSIAVVLFILILLAGVLMIASSMNSSIAQRTKFFGMMRCIGMNKRQIIHFVRLEALNWCKTAVPIGSFFGIITTWGLCAVLRFYVGDEFAHIPLFGISMIGIMSGVIMGIVTVLIAASSPAKKAARVSPVSAVSGASDTTTSGHGVPKRKGQARIKIESALGIQHALSSKKNYCLMTASFALSIVLFLVFSVFIDFIGYLMPQFTNDYDIGITSNDGLNTIDAKLTDTISQMEGVHRVFARQNMYDIPATFEDSKVAVHEVDLISYGAFDLDSLTKDKKLKRGSDVSKVYGDSPYVLATWDPESMLRIGDKIRVGDMDLEIAGLLTYDPFSSDGKTHGEVTLIASPQTYKRLTGIEKYSLVMVQVTKDATDAEVEAIYELVGNNTIFRDKRDQRTTSTYVAFLFFVYGFLAIITLVTVLNIMNSISMSVSARIKQYGAMRAVGMDSHQLTKMIIAEALTYALSGAAIGCLIGLLLSKGMYDVLITSHYAYALWNIPIGSIMIIVIGVLCASIAAVYRPSKRIRGMAITETLKEL